MLFSRVFIVSVAWLVIGCATLAPEQDPVLGKLTELESRLIDVERSLDTQGLLSLQSQLMDALQETSELRGELETLQFELTGSSERLREAYVTTDQRLQALEQRSFGAAPSPFVPPSAQQANTTAPAISDREAYQQAFELLKAARYDEAATAFTRFVQQYPSSTFADNAQYWLGEAHYVSRRFPEAKQAFDAVLAQYPQSRKIPDATLKVGLCQFELGDKMKAKSTLSNVQTNYPGTSAARLAAERLASLF